jgi:hypothetical protein
VGVHPYAYYANDMAQLRQADLIAEADHHRLVRSAVAHPAGRLSRYGNWLEEIATSSGHERWEKWQETYCKLIEVVARSGFHVENDPVLAGWVREQQKLHRLSVLGRKRVRLLEAVPGWRWHPAPAPASALPLGVSQLRFSSWASQLVSHQQIRHDYRQTGLVQVIT